MTINFKQYLIEKFQLTLKYHPRLNPRLWEGETLREDIRERLLEEGYAFAEFCELPRSAVVDIVLTGGNANFNYTKYSDLDVHVVYSESTLSHDELFEKKKSWSEIRPVEIEGIPLELYAQDAGEGFKPTQGVYSLVDSQWIAQPQRVDASILKDTSMITKVKQAMTHVKHLVKSGSREEIHSYRERLREMRAAGLSEPAGEFSVENVLYKELRNRGLLDVLKYAEAQRPED